jgi:glycosyltransferase involved in cell wall biosynthesis
MRDPRPGEPPIVSIVIAVRNEGSHLEPCIEALRGQDYQADRMEILVAEGRSEDGTRARLEAYAREDPRIRVLDNPGRIVPTGLNAAIRECRGEIVVRIDGHTVVAPDYVSRAVDALHRTGADVVGGNMTPVARGIFGRSVALATSTPMGVGGSRFHYATGEEDAETVYMGSFRRDVFSRFGSFDEHLIRNQDDEFNYRIREKGGRIVLIPGMRSQYAPRESPWKLLKQYFQYGLYKVGVASRHPRMTRPRHIIPSVFVLLLAALALGSVRMGWARFALAALLASHAAASLLVSWRDGRHALGAWLLVPLTTLILHTGYGGGFVLGCAAALAGRAPGSPRRSEGRAA